MWVNEFGEIVGGDKQPTWREATQEEIDSYFLSIAKAEAIKHAKEQITELELQALRPLRAIANQTATEFDLVKLADIETSIEVQRQIVRDNS